MHLFEIADITSTDTLCPVNPQLTEVNRTAIEIGDISNEKFALLFPVCNSEATADDGTVALDVEAAVLRTEAEGLIEVIGAWCQMDGDFCRLSCSLYFSRFSYCISQR